MLKSMMRFYCYEQGRDWDEGVHLLLFAVREAVQDSLGFSPFELFIWERGAWASQGTQGILVRGG